MKYIYGEIYDSTNRILFSSEDNSHFFCFMPGYYTKNGIDVISIPSKDKLIFGRTFDNRQIAIYTGADNLEFAIGQGFHTSVYILSQQSLPVQQFHEFDAISFYGGTIKKVYKPHGLKIQHGPALMDETETVPAKLQDDYRCFTVDLGDEGKAEIDIGSTVKYSSGDNGNYIDNSEVVLTIRFSKRQPIQKFFAHYQVVINLLSFMTYRQNVTFDKITLNQVVGNEGYINESAEVYIEKEGKLTNKEFFRCIRVEDLGDAFEELIRIAYAIPGKDTEGKELNDALPPSGYIPENDMFSSIMSTSKIREICSAIEYELQFAKGINVKENETIQKLCKDVKKTIKEFRKSNPDLSNDAYSSLIGNLRYWLLPLRERITALCMKYSEEIALMAISRYGEGTGIQIDSTKVKEFVDYRNGITHNSSRPLNQSVTSTAFLLSGVVYCCVLERIGVSKTQIQQLCTKGMIR